MKELLLFQVLNTESRFKLQTLRQLILHGWAGGAPARLLHSSHNVYQKQKKIPLTLTLKHDPKIKHEQSSGDWLLKPRLQNWKNQIFQDRNFSHLDNSNVHVSKACGPAWGPGQAHSQTHSYGVSTCYGTELIKFCLSAPRGRSSA